jgi:hypothetical protein
MKTTAFEEEQEPTNAIAGVESQLFKGNCALPFASGWTSKRNGDSQT